MGKVLTEADHAWGRARLGNREGFSCWVRLCEIPLRQSLRPFAPAVDVESVLQEGLLRMWRLAPTLELTGEDASLRFAHRLVRNLAISEVRRLRKENLVAIADDDDPPAIDRPIDDWFREAVRTCLGNLPRRPREALLARLSEQADRDAAAGLGIKLNTFLQGIVRARRLMDACLRTAGIRIEEYLS